MGGLNAVTLPPQKPTSSSSKIRFIGFLKQPESDSKPDFELDESDVIWSSSAASDLKSDPSDSDSESESSTRVVRNRHSSAVFGLSAVFAEDRGVAIRLPVKSLTGGVGHDKLMAKSAPMNVPTWHRRRFDRELDDLEEKDDDVVGEVGDDDVDGEMVPPHVLVARSHVTTFSVFEGVGRTLKGRDLRRVRNAVFQQTGFLD